LATSELMIVKHLASECFWFTKGLFWLHCTRLKRGSNVYNSASRTVIV